MAWWIVLLNKIKKMYSPCLVSVVHISFWHNMLAVNNNQRKYILITQSRAHWYDMKFNFCTKIGHGHNLLQQMLKYIENIRRWWEEARRYDFFLSSNSKNNIPVQTCISWGTMIYCFIMIIRSLLDCPLPQIVTHADALCVCLSHKSLLPTPTQIQLTSTFLDKHEGPRSSI